MNDRLNAAAKRVLNESGIENGGKRERGCGCG